MRDLCSEAGGLGEQAGRQAFTAASFPPGSWLQALNLTSDDLVCSLPGNSSIARSSWASSLLSSSFKARTLSQPRVASAAPKVSPLPEQDPASWVRAGGASPISNLFSLPLVSLHCSPFRIDDFGSARSRYR